MNQITLIEDTCLRLRLNFNIEKAVLIRQGYSLVTQYSHPAIGKIAILKQPISPSQPNSLDLANAEIFKNKLT